MNPESYRTFNRRGREQELTARPLLVLYRGESTGSHNNQKQNKKPFTQISLQNRPSAGGQNKKRSTRPLELSAGTLVPSISSLPSLLIPQYLSYLIPFLYLSLI